MQSFFPMSRGDLAYIVSVLAFAVVAFLPWARDVEVGGMALVGWLMAALMIFAPIVALVRIATRRPASKTQDEAP